MTKSSQRQPNPRRERDAKPNFPLVRQNVLHQVRRAIALGRIAPGSRLTERQLCEDYGISRTAAREVIRQLDSEHLGEAVPHQGLRIVRLTPKMVREIYEIRAELEALIVRTFIEVATEDQIAHLRDIIRDLDAAMHAPDPDPERVIDLSRRYIAHMNAAADKQIAGEILAQLDVRIVAVRALAISRPGQTEAGVRQLDRIRERIAARDADGAEAEVRSYMRAALASALHQLEGGG